MTDTDRPARPRLIVTRRLAPHAEARMAELFDTVLSADDHDMDDAELVAAMQDCDVLVPTLNDHLTAELIDQAGPRLKLIANFGNGIDHIDLKAARAKGIIVTNTPGVLDETTADFAWALLLAAARRVGEAERWLRAGEWQHWSFDRLLGADVHGSTLGILGMGRIGQAIARRAIGFGMRVTYHNRTRLAADIERAHRAEWLAFDDLLASADHLVLALPYSPESHHLVDARALARMKPTAVLVNIARGGIVDDGALAEALREGRLAAAGLDQDAWGSTP